MIARRRLVLGVLALASLAATVGCARGCASSRPPIHINPSMDNQPKVRPQTASAFFYDGASMRQPVPGTIPIGGLQEDQAFFTGKGADGQFVAAIPVTVDEALLERGSQRYVIYCQPCHDARGDGRGILFQRGNVPTASFHQEKFLTYADGQIFDVITNGQGLIFRRWSAPSGSTGASIPGSTRRTRSRASRPARGTTISSMSTRHI
jgi:hypothetical protein